MGMSLRRHIRAEHLVSLFVALMKYLTEILSSLKANFCRLFSLEHQFNRTNRYEISR